MNEMCDMSQFVIVISVLDESFAILASHFMQHVLMKFGFFISLCWTMALLLKELLSLCARR